MILALLESSGLPAELQWFASLGVGGVIAGFSIVLWFRSAQAHERGRKEAEERYMEERKASEARYAALGNEFRSIVQDNTRAVSTLITIIERSSLRECPYTREVHDQRDAPSLRRKT